MVPVQITKQLVDFSEKFLSSPHKVHYLKSEDVLLALSILDQVEMINICGIVLCRRWCNERETEHETKMYGEVISVMK